MTNLRILSIVREGDGYYPQLKVQIKDRTYNLIFKMGGVKLQALRNEEGRAVMAEDFLRVQALAEVVPDLLAKVELAVRECEAVCNAEGESP